MTDLTLEKRIENLEKVYIMLEKDTEKKLEMLRENNNLLAEEIKKLGGFKEDDDFEALDLSSIKEICNAFERVYGKGEYDDGVVNVPPQKQIYKKVDRMIIQKNACKNCPNLIVIRDKKGNLLELDCKKKTKIGGIE